MSPCGDPFQVRVEYMWTFSYGLGLSLSNAEGILEEDANPTCQANFAFIFQYLVIQIS